jgi:hypothetical protein
MDSITYIRKRQLPRTPLTEGGEGGSALIEGGRGEKMPDPRIKCGAGKSGMTNAKKKGFSMLFNINQEVKRS